MYDFDKITTELIEQQNKIEWKDFSIEKLITILGWCIPGL
jgi:hypothetical protein